MDQQEMIEEQKYLWLRVVMVQAGASRGHFEAQLRFYACLNKIGKIPRSSSHIPSPHLHQPHSVLYHHFDAEEVDAVFTPDRPNIY